MPLPTLTSKQWAELKSHLVEDSRDPFDPSRALKIAYPGQKGDDQPKFRRGILA